MINGNLKYNLIHEFFYGRWSFVPSIFTDFFSVKSEKKFLDPSFFSIGNLKMKTLENSTTKDIHSKTSEVKHPVIKQKSPMLR